jgi:hypothetical protein
MNNRIYIPFSFIILTLLALFVAGCGPSPEEISKQTAAAWTATPAPTNTPAPTPTSTPTTTPTPTSTPSPTPIPIPYDLTVRIADADDNPITWAQVNLIELEDIIMTDESGEVVWIDLSGENATIAVTAQGFFPDEIASTLERGSNEIVIKLEGDPFGLLPTEACAPGENLLYIEDFQDGKAQGWPEVEVLATGWNVVPFEEGNLVLAGGEEASPSNLQDFNFDNAVWRMRFIYDGEANPNLLWRNTGDSSYQIGLLTRGIGTGGMDRFQDGTGITVRTGNFNVSIDELYYLEISTFEGVVNIWLNGEEIMSPYEDPMPWSAGTIGIEPWMNPGSTIYYDDFSVCELNSPFVSIYTPETEE